MEAVMKCMSDAIEFVSQMSPEKIFICGALIVGIVSSLIMFAAASASTSDIKDYTSGGLIPMFEALMLMVVCVVLLAIALAA